MDFLLPSDTSSKMERDEPSTSTTPSTVITSIPAPMMQLQEDSAESIGQQPPPPSVDSSIHTSLVNFGLFPNLAPKLHNEIWSIVAHHSCVIEVGGYKKRGFGSSFKFSSKTLAPAILRKFLGNKPASFSRKSHNNFRQDFSSISRSTSRWAIADFRYLDTCSDPRAEGLKVYDELNFDDHFTRTYINWESDFISFVSRKQYLDMFQKTLNVSDHPEMIQKCKRLALLSRSEVPFAKIFKKMWRKSSSSMILHFQDGMNRAWEI